MFVFVFVCVCLRLRVQVSQGAISDLLLASCNDVQEIERPKPFTHHHFFQVDLSSFRFVASKSAFPHTHTHTHTRIHLYARSCMAAVGLCKQDVARVCRE